MLSLPWRHRCGRLAVCAVPSQGGNVPVHATSSFLCSVTLSTHHAKAERRTGLPPLALPHRRLRFSPRDTKANRTPLRVAESEVDKILLLAVPCFSLAGWAPCDDVASKWLDPVNRLCFPWILNKI